MRCGYIVEHVVQNFRIEILLKPVFFQVQQLFFKIIQKKEILVLECTYFQ
jgi:hypothetical protein